MGSLHFHDIMSFSNRDYIFPFMKKVIATLEDFFFLSTCVCEMAKAKGCAQVGAPGSGVPLLASSSPGAS